MLNSLLSISTRSILCPLHIHVLTVTTTVRTCRFSHFHIDSICHWEHYPPLPLAGPATRPTIITYSLRGYATSYGYFFAEIPSTSDLRPMHMFTTSVSPREKKNERHKSKPQKYFSIFYILRSLDGSEWPIYLPYLFIYLFICILPGT